MRLNDYHGRQHHDRRLVVETCLLTFVIEIGGLRRSLAWFDREDGSDIVNTKILMTIVDCE